MERHWKPKSENSESSTENKVKEQLIECQKNVEELIRSLGNSPSTK
jgi:hypothetical protein